MIQLTCRVAALKHPGAFHSQSWASASLVISYCLSSLTALRVVARAADLHHADFRGGLALFATVFTVLRCRAPAGLSRALFLVLFVCHLNQPPRLCLAEGSHLPVFLRRVEDKFKLTLRRRLRR